MTISKPQHDCLKQVEGGNYWPVKYREHIDGLLSSGYLKWVNGVRLTDKGREAIKGAC